MTAEEHYRRARLWGDRFDVLLGWVTPIRYANVLLVGITLGAYAVDEIAGDVGLALLLFWTCVRSMHQTAAKFCLRRLELHGERYMKMQGCK